VAAVPADGWRARDRKAARTAALALATPGAAPGAARGDTRDAAPAQERPGSEPLYRSLSRPQEIGHPQPTVLEWTAQPAADPYQPVIAPQRLAAPLPGYPSGPRYR
jgi:hypothetical protein